MIKFLLNNTKDLIGVISFCIVIIAFIILILFDDKERRKIYIRIFIVTLVICIFSLSQIYSDYRLYKNIKVLLFGEEEPEIDRTSVFALDYFEEIEKKKAFINSLSNSEKERIIKKIELDQKMNELFIEKQ